MSNPYEPPTAQPENVPSKWAWNGNRAHSARITVAVAATLTLLVMADRSRNATSPNWVSVAGPFSYMARTDNYYVAWAVAFTSLLGLGSFIVWPRWYTLPLALLSIAAWIGVGVRG